MPIWLVFLSDIDAAVSVRFIEGDRYQLGMDPDEVAHPKSA